MQSRPPEGEQTGLAVPPEMLRLAAGDVLAKIEGCHSFDRLHRRDARRGGGKIGRQGEKLSFQLLVDILSLSHSSHIKNHDCTVLLIMKVTQ